MQQLKNLDVVNVFLEEGLEYFVLHYCDGSAIEDPETARLHWAAREGLEAYRQHIDKLEAKYNRED